MSTNDFFKLKVMILSFDVLIETSRNSPVNVMILSFEVLIETSRNSPDIVHVAAALKKFQLLCGDLI